MAPPPLAAHAVILAGGRGTRFWPRSRARAPKQLLNILGSETMLQQTAARLAPLFPAARTWVVTGAAQAAGVRRQLPGVPRAQVLAEPLGRNTAAAIGLAAIHIAGAHGDAVMAVLPADHSIRDAARYRRVVGAALRVAAEEDALVVLGIPPTRPETGFGYIETAGRPRRVAGQPVYDVRRFTEKPSLARARRYVRSPRYLWNAGMFFWRASAYLGRLRRHLPATHAALLRLGETIGTPRYPAALRRIWPRLENISVDYAVMEPAARGRAGGVRALPAEVGWSDIGSWAALYELLARRRGENVSAGECFTLGAAGNLFWSPRKFVAALGVRDLVVVDTPDALLICPRDRSQDVSRVVKWLEQRRKTHLL